MPTIDQQIEAINHRLATIEIKIDRLLATAEMVLTATAWQPATTSTARPAFGDPRG